MKNEKKRNEDDDLVIESSQCNGAKLDDYKFTISLNGETEK